MKSLGHRYAEKAALRKRELCWTPLGSYAKRAKLRKEKVFWTQFGKYFERLH